MAPVMRVALPGFFLAAWMRLRKLSSSPQISCLMRFRKIFQREGWVGSKAGAAP